MGYVFCPLHGITAVEEQGMTSLGLISKKLAWYMHHHPMLMLEGGCDLLQSLAFAGSFLCP